VLKDKILRNFYPDKYDILVKGNGLVELCIVRRGRLGRYCIVYVEINRDLDLSTDIERVRKDASRCLDAMWLLKEIGAFFVIKTSGNVKSPEKLKNAVDRTGFHAVIIQGVYIQSSTETYFFESKWFKHSFGDAKDIISSLNTMDNG
jgi:hypothetical protein